MTAINPKDGRVRDRDYMGFVAKCPCIACMVAGKINWRVQVAHLRAGSLEHGKRPTGMQEKPSDKWVTPLCMPHHTGDVRQVQNTQHAGGEEVFWADLGIDPFALCLALYDAFKRGLSGPAIIATFAAAGRKAIEEKAAHARD